MSVTTTSNVNYAVVGKGTATTVLTAASKISDLEDGQIGIFTPTGGVAAIGSGEKFVIAMGGRAGKPVFVSEVIDPAKVEVARSRGGIAATEQIDAVGYNGATGAIANLAANTLYKVDFYIQEYLRSNSDGRLIKHGQYISGAAVPTQIEVAEGLANSIILNFSREAEDYIQLDVHSAGAPTALTGTGTLTIANGSKYLTAGTDIDAVLVVGGYVRLDESVGGATALTDSVYKIVAIDTANEIATLDRPYTGTSLSAAAVGNGSYIAKATADAAAAGFTVTGKPLSFVLGKENYEKARWELILKDLDGTTYSRVQDASKGHGTYEDVAEQEWFAKGNEGEYHRMGEPTIYVNSANAALGTVYDTTIIRWVEDSVVGFQANVSPKQITLLSADGADFMTDAAAAGGVWLNLNAAIVAAKREGREANGVETVANTLVLS
jgi:hypothetical protein